MPWVLKKKNAAFFQKAAFFLMEKIEEKRYNSSGFSPELRL